MNGEQAWEELERIRQQHGGDLQPEAVVEAARPEESPLHAEFEWDDAVAGEQYRLDQARQLIRRVRLIDAGHPDAPRDLRAYINIRTGGQPGRYVPTEQVGMDPVAREVVLRSMQREWAGFVRRYRELQEFWTMVEGTVEAERSDDNGGTAANGG